MKSRTIYSSDELDALHTAIIASAEATLEALRDLTARTRAITLLERLKFEQVGRDPLSDRPLNLIEQVNQTFTYLATIEAVRYLFRQHADRAPFVINLGTASGFDIESHDRRLAAEVFAAVSPKSNDKLRKDVRRVHAAAAEWKYVFYTCPGIVAREQPRLRGFDDVTIVSLGPCGEAFFRDSEGHVIKRITLPKDGHSGKA